MIMKKLFNVLPEYYLIGMGIFWIIQLFVSSGRIGYITMLATWLLFIQIFYKNKACGIFYGLLFSAISVLKIYKGFTLVIEEGAVSGEAVQLFSVFSITFAASVAMLIKYATATQKYDKNILTMTS